MLKKLDFRPESGNTDTGDIILGFCVSVWKYVIERMLKGSRIETGVFACMKEWKLMMDRGDFLKGENLNSRVVPEYAFGLGIIPLTITYATSTQNELD